MCNHLLSHWEVSLNQRIQQPLFKDYPKNITKIVQAKGNHLKLYQEALQKWTSQISLIYFIAKSPVGVVRISGWRSDPANWWYHLSWPQQFFKQGLTTDPKHIQLFLLFHVYKCSHKAPDQGDASYFTHTWFQPIYTPFISINYIFCKYAYNSVILPACLGDWSILILFINQSC